MQKKYDSVCGGLAENLSSFISVLRFNELVSHPVVLNFLGITESHASNLLSSHVTESGHSTEKSPFHETELSILEVVKHARVNNASSSSTRSTHEFSREIAQPAVAHWLLAAEH